MTAWLTSLRDRPIAESERAAAMATVTVLLLAAAILLALSRPPDKPRPTPLRHPARASLSARPPAAQTPESSTAPLTPLVARAADLFLAGYLGYMYGHAPASAIDGATPALLRSLRAHPTRVSPGMRARRPHVLALRSTPAPSGPLRVSAVVNDGGLVDYSIGLLLAAHGGRLLVSGLEGGE